MSLKYLITRLTIYLHTYEKETMMFKNMYILIPEIIMFRKESGSADTKYLIKVSSKSALSNCLNRILNYLDTSFSNDLGVGRSSCHDSN
jgi:hypothetical protein